MNFIGNKKKEAKGESVPEIVPELASELFSEGLVRQELQDKLSSKDEHEVLYDQERDFHKQKEQDLSHDHSEVKLSNEDIQSGEKSTNIGQSENYQKQKQLDQNEKQISNIGLKDQVRMVDQPVQTSEKTSIENNNEIDSGYLGGYNGLFSRLSKHLESNTLEENREFLTQLTQNDLLSMMKEHSQKQREGKSYFIMHEKDIELGIKEKLFQLHGFEEKWRSLEHEIFEKNIIMKDIEAKIHSEIQQLQELIYELNNLKNLKKTELPEEKWFRLVDGNVLKSLRDFKNSLENMTDETFYYHANSYKNDFVKWVRNVFLEHDLANKLYACKNRENALKLLNEFFN